MKPTITMLSENERLSIHEATLTVLETTGVEIDCPEVVSALVGFGAKAAGNRVRFEKAMIRDVLSLIVKDVTLYARDKVHDLSLPKTGMTFNSTGGYSPFFYDAPNMPRRKSTAKDLAMVARLADNLEEVDFFWPICVPTEEVNIALEEISSLHTAMLNTGKHVQCSCASAAGAEWMIRMGEAAAGGSAALRERPLFSAVSSPTTPLAFEASTSEAIMRLSKAGIPIVPMNVPLAGATAPSTFAGALVITNAEQLATLAIIKAFNPDAPMVYAADTGSADMKSGDVAYTNPDYDLYSIACGDMARFYEMPSCVSHGSSEVRDFATISGFERNVLKIAMSQLTKTDLSCWIGSKDNCMSTSLWDIVLDAEALRFAKHYLREPKVNPETLALSVIDEVGPRGEFISHEHTLAHFREEICLDAIDQGFLFRGRNDFQETALEKAKRLTGDAKTSEAGLSKDLAELMKDARKEIARSNA